MAKQYDLIVKLLLIGDSGVGKTCMICKFADEKFEENEHSTIGIDFKMKRVMLKEKRVRIQLWDTAGQERYETMTTQYYRRAQGIFLVYDITKWRSFDNIQKWYNYVKEYGAEDVELMILANKTDISSERKVPTSAGAELANRLQIPFHETSAKDDECSSMEVAFLEMASVVMEKHRREYDRISLHLEREDSEGSEYVSELLRNDEKRGCCS